MTFQGGNRFRIRILKQNKMKIQVAERQQGFFSFQKINDNVYTGK